MIVMDPYSFNVALCTRGHVYVYVCAKFLMLDCNTNSEWLQMNCIESTRGMNMSFRITLCFLTVISHLHSYNSSISVQVCLFIIS